MFFNYFRNVLKYESVNFLRRNKLENLLFSLNATIPIFLLMIVGYFLNKVNIIDDVLASKMNTFVFKISLPLLLYVDVSDSNFADLWDTKFVIFCVVATLLSILLSILFSLRLKNKDTQGEFIQACYRSSAALLGLALTKNIYPNVGVAPLMLMSVVFVYNVVSVIILSFFKPEQEKIDYKKTFLGVLKNPLIIGIVCGVLVGFLPFSIPGVINKTISMISQTATPLGLMAMGATFDFSKAKGELKQSLFCTFMKLFGFCAIFLPIAVALGFQKQALVAILIMLGSSTTVSAFVMAKNMGHKGVLTSSVVMLTTLLSAFSITFWLTVLKSFGLI